MNGFADRGLDEDAFAEKKGNIVQAFDAFPKAKPQYVTRTSGGGKWTLTVMIISFLLGISELSRWWQGYETHTFSVEKGVGHEMQINLDMVVAMHCDDIHINVQDASGDRILAASRLKRDPTNWAQWADKSGVHRLGKDKNGKIVTGEGHDEGFGEEHVHDIVAGASKKQKWAKTPHLSGIFSGKGAGRGDSCRVFGSLEVNRVQGDFHLTARGHGYMEAGQHLDHQAFNFSHIINELSFGQFYPSLLNPLDRTISTTDVHFNKFQYFLSVVPTVYRLGSTTYSRARTLITNQYAVTEQNHAVGERSVPGVFFKYDMEPMLLTVVETRDGFLIFCIKLINVLSGVLVAGHWGFTISDWVREVIGRRRRSKSSGVLHGRGTFSDDEH